ncbi:hypothetical protein ACQRXC_27455 (plasmid) [Niallia taxi]|uniref:Uncharacterized protein n=1 Tax=Niallia taxi TaxID=2499688 RepID=A0A437K2S6_9BACI|nr:hypothetical protein [Niallia taxi]MDK8643748.1 hypothetical protein [Niallia taxi]MED4057791.1 hypothetical protein [Niallia taxi]RVT56369.1 hypothetical protein EM808_27685 [Niallia taxi]
MNSCLSLFNRTKSVNNSGTESQEDETIYTMMPTPGTIIGEATEEEMETAAEPEIRYTVFMRRQDMKVVSIEQTTKLAKNIQNFETDSSKF